MELIPKEAGAGENPAKKGDLAVTLRKRFGGAFELNVAFAISPGITILFGQSGAGKTTLLDCIAGVMHPDSGTVSAGERVFFGEGVTVPAFRRSIAYVFQNLALFPHLTVEKNVAYGIAHLPAGERTRRVHAILGDFRIAQLRERKPGQISGGEAQRVALARALVTNPRALLLDEPLAALDAATKSKIMEDLRNWNQAHCIPILYVTHNREEVFALGERVLLLAGGGIVADGSPHAVMSAPRQETVAQLAGFENILDATVVSAHEERGTMTCRVQQSGIELETPLIRADAGTALRIGVRAGDILLATVLPQGLSARNVLPGEVMSLVQRDMVIVARVNCGVELAVHLTLAARDALRLESGTPVWLVIKTHSCHLMTS